MPVPSFSICPLCCDSIVAGDHTYCEDGFFGLCCACGCQFNPGVRSIEELAKLWNTRFVPSETIQMVIDSELAQPQPKERTFLQSPSFFYWLSCVFFSLMAFNSTPNENYPFGLAGVFFFCAIYGLLYGVSLAWNALPDEGVR